MKGPLTQEELRMNEQATAVATSVVGETIEAATRCEQVTQDQQLEAAGAGGFSRGFIKASMGMSRVMMPRTMGGIKNMETGGLPKSFVLAASSSKVYAIEDKQDGGKLVPGKLLHEWDRATFTARLSEQRGISVMSGAPEDRQILILYLKLDGGKSKYMQAAARMQEAAGSPGQPHRVMVGKDAASESLIEAVTANAPAPGANMSIGGQNVADMMAQAQAAATAADPADQLTKLADLRDRGVLSDDEFAAQKAKILGTS